MWNPVARVKWLMVHVKPHIRCLSQSVSQRDQCAWLTYVGFEHRRHWRRPTSTLLSLLFSNFLRHNSSRPTRITFLPDIHALHAHVDWNEFKFPVVIAPIICHYQLGMLLGRAMLCYLSETVIARLDWAVNWSWCNDNAAMNTIKLWWWCGPIVVAWWSIMCDFTGNVPNKVTYGMRNTRM